MVRDKRRGGELTPGHQSGTGLLGWNRGGLSQSAEYPSDTVILSGSMIGVSVFYFLPIFVSILQSQLHNRPCGYPVNNARMRGNLSNYANSPDKESAS